MAFATRNVFWSFINPDGSSSAPSNAVIFFLLDRSTWIDATTVVPFDIAAPVGVTGSGSTTLFVNDSGIVDTQYRLICPFLGISKLVTIASGDPLNILVLLYDVAVTVAPAAPTLAALNNGSVNVTVSPLLPDASSYKLQRATAIGGLYAEIVVGVTSFPYNDTTVLFSTQYYYRAVATNVAGDSLPSVAATVTTVAITTPDIPTLTMAGVSGLSVHLTTTVTARVQNYQIWRSTTSGTETLLTTVIVALGAAMDYTDNTVLDSTTYFYKVKANNTGGTSAFSNEVTAVVSTLPVFTPVDPTAIAGNVLHFRMLPQGAGGAGDGLPLTLWPDGTPAGWGHTCAMLSDVQQPLIFLTGVEGPNGKKFIGFDSFNQSGFSILQNSFVEPTLTIKTLIVAVRFWNNSASVGALLPNLFIGTGTPDTIRVDGVLQSGTYVLPNGRCSVLAMEYAAGVQMTGLGGTAHDWDIIDCCGFSSALIASDRDGVTQFIRNANSLPYQTPVITGTASPSNPPLIIIDGDSQSANPTYQTKLAALLSGTFTYSNFAIPGASINMGTIVANIASVYDATRYVILIEWAGTNEVATGSPSPLGAIVQFRARRYVERAQRQGIKNVVMGTAMKRDFSGDLATEEAQRTIFNNAMTSNALAFGNFIADIGAAPNLQNPSDTTYFQSDKAHLTSAGYDQVCPIVAAEVTLALV